MIKTKILYLAVDKDESMHMFEIEPVRIDNEYWDDMRAQSSLMTVSVSQLRFFGIPDNRTWNDAPLEVTITINEYGNN